MGGMRWRWMAWLGWSDGQRWTRYIYASDKDMSMRAIDCFTRSPSMFYTLCMSCLAQTRRNAIPTRMCLRSRQQHQQRRRRRRRRRGSGALRGSFSSRRPASEVNNPKRLLPHATAHFLGEQDSVQPRLTAAARPLHPHPCTHIAQSTLATGHCPLPTHCLARLHQNPQSSHA